VKLKFSIAFSILSLLVGCDQSSIPPPTTKFIYFGYEDGTEQPQDVLKLAKTWGNSPPCKHWRATINKKEADYQVLFGKIQVATIIDRRGQVLYSGGAGVLYLPHGNPDGSGVNVCKLTGEPDTK
jgi:hypothetical protein